MEFSERLKKLRKEKDIKQKDLAKALGYGATAISNYESGKNEPSIQDLKRIADYLEVSVDYLIGHDRSINEKDIIERTKRELVEKIIGVMLEK